MTVNQESLLDRCRLLTLTRAELVGPSLVSENSRILTVTEGTIDLGDADGPVFVTDGYGAKQEVVYYARENPTRKYGVGVMHAQLGGSAELAEPNF